MFLHREKCHSHGVRAGLRQLKSQLSALALKELVGDLKKNAGAVASLGVASTSAAVGQIEENLNSLAYDVMRFLTANIGDESDPASIMLLRRMV
jgi:hypothetical protein